MVISHRCCYLIQCHVIGAAIGIYIPAPAGPAGKIAAFKIYIGRALGSDCKYSKNKKQAKHQV
jgi:hypothetical protein